MVCVVQFILWYLYVWCLCSGVIDCLSDDVCRGEHDGD